MKKIAFQHIGAFITEIGTPKTGLVVKYFDQNYDGIFHVLISHLTKLINKI